MSEIPEEVRDLAETAEANGHREVREPLVYQFHERRSFFADRAIAATDKPDARAAGERLEHHKRQMAAMPKAETRSYPGTNFEYRVNPNLETGHGLEFTVPLWLNEYFATARRAGQAVGRLVQEQGREFDLPQGVSSIALPRLTQGTVATSQTPNAPVANQDVESKEVKAQALIYSGESDWSLQALEQSPQGAYLDWVMFTDLTESLDAEFERECITGRGEAFNEALGLLEISGINSVTYTAAAPTGTGMFPAIGKAIAQVGAKRKRPPKALLWTTSRHAWLTTSEDLVDRPMPFEDYDNQDWPIAGFSGFPIYPDDAISTELGASKEQDAIIACHVPDFILWHSPIRTAVDHDVLSGTMGVRFLLYRTTATMLHRYPSGISKVEGTGMKVQEGFS